MDGDGLIDYLEFVQAAIDHRAMLNSNNIKAIFRMLDSNGDGNIDMQELKSNFSDMGDDIFTDIIAEVDKDGDN